MKTVILLFGLLFSTFCLQAQDYEDVMSEAYWKIWNSDVRASIDKNIEQYRKGDAKLNIPSGVTVKIEQLSHSFIFGGNIFLFGQLETMQQNKQYENTFGALFNSATLPFYWKTLEPEQGKPRYTVGSSYIFRRPPVDPILEFCESNKIMEKAMLLFMVCAVGDIRTGCRQTAKRWNFILKNIFRNWHRAIRIEL